MRKRLKQVALAVLDRHLRCLKEENEQRERAREGLDAQISALGATLRGDSSKKAKGSQQTGRSRKTLSVREKAELKRKQDGLIKKTESLNAELKETLEDIRNLEQRNFFNRFVLSIIENDGIVFEVRRLVGSSAHDDSQTEVALKLILDILVPILASFHLFAVLNGANLLSVQPLERAKCLLNTMSPPALPKEGVPLGDQAYQAMVGQSLLSLIVQDVSGQGGNDLLFPVIHLTKLAMRSRYILSSLQQAELTDQQKGMIKSFLSEKSPVRRRMPAEAFIAFYVFLAHSNNPREFALGLLVAGSADPKLSKSGWLCSSGAASQRTSQEVKPKKVAEKSVEQILGLTSAGADDYLNANRSANSHLLEQGAIEEYCLQEARHYASIMSNIAKWAIARLEPISEEVKNFLISYLFKLETRLFFSTHTSLLVAVKNLVEELSRLKLSAPPRGPLAYAAEIFMVYVEAQKDDFEEKCDDSGAIMHRLTYLNTLIPAYERFTRTSSPKDSELNTFFQMPDCTRVSTGGVKTQALQSIHRITRLIPYLFAHQCFGANDSSPYAKKSNFIEQIGFILTELSGSSEQKVISNKLLDLPDERVSLARENNRALEILNESKACCSELKKRSSLDEYAVMNLEKINCSLSEKFESVRTYLTQSPYRKLVLYFYFSLDGHESPEKKEASVKHFFSYPKRFCSSEAPASEGLGVGIGIGAIQELRDWLLDRRGCVTGLLFMDQTAAEGGVLVATLGDYTAGVWGSFFAYSRILYCLIQSMNDLESMSQRAKEEKRKIDKKKYEKFLALKTELGERCEEYKRDWAKRGAEWGKTCSDLIERQAAFSSQVESIETRVADWKAKLSERKDFFDSDESKRLRKELNDAVDEARNSFNNFSSALVDFNVVVSRVNPSVDFVQKKIRGLLRELEKVQVHGLKDLNLADDLSAWCTLLTEIKVAEEKFLTSGCATTDSSKVIFNGNPFNCIQAEYQACRECKKQVSETRRWLDSWKARLRKVNETLIFIGDFCSRANDQKALRGEIKRAILSCTKAMEDCEPLFKFAEQAELSDDFPDFSQTVPSLEDDASRLDVMVEQFLKISLDPTDSDNALLLESCNSCKQRLKAHAARSAAIAEKLAHDFDRENQALSRLVADIGKRLKDKSSSNELLQKPEVLEVLSALKNEIGPLQEQFERSVRKLGFYEGTALLDADEKRTASVVALRQNLRLIWSLHNTLGARARLEKLKARKKNAVPVPKTAVPEESSCSQALEAGDDQQALSSDIELKLKELAILEEELLGLADRLSSVKEITAEDPSCLKRETIAGLQTELDAVQAQIRSIRDQKSALLKELVEQILRAVKSVKLGDSEAEKDAEKDIDLALKDLAEAGSGVPGISVFESEESGTCDLRVQTTNRLFLVRIPGIRTRNSQLWDALLTLDQTKFGNTERFVSSLVDVLDEQVNDLKKEIETSSEKYNKQLAALLDKVLCIRGNTDRCLNWIRARPSNLNDRRDWLQQAGRFCTWLNTDFATLTDMTVNLYLQYSQKEETRTHIKRVKAYDTLQFLNRLSLQVEDLAIEAERENAGYYQPIPYASGYLSNFFEVPIITTRPQACSLSRPVFGH